MIPQHEYQRVALVLSGGGGNGAFQVGAEAYCRHRMGLTWSVVAGQSVGALNGYMIAAGRYSELQALWDSLSNRKIFRPISVWRTLAVLLFRRLGLMSNAPLHQLLTEYVREDMPPKIPFRFGAVDLLTGQYVQFDENDVSPENLRASASIPLVFPPVGSLIDGAIRNNGPIGDVMDIKPDLVVIINCKPRVSVVDAPMPTNLIEILTRTASIIFDEAFRNDYALFTKINEIIDYGTELINPDTGQAYRKIDSIFIEPDRHLGPPLDFSKESVVEKLQKGWYAAEEAFETAGWA